MEWSAFDIVYLLGFLVGSVIRKVYHVRAGKQKIRKSYQGGLDWVFVVLAGLGLMSPLLYLFTDVLGFADYQVPVFTGCLGAAVFAAALALLWKSHSDLGKHFAPTLRIGQEHSLVTSGVYAYIRHPMYAAHWLWAVAQVLLVGNWIAGPAFLVTFWPVYLLRVRTEETMMLDEFGDAYRLYMRRAGRIIPHLGFT